jgi:hypothetical protein
LTGLRTAVLSLVANLVILAVGRLAGADLLVTPPGADTNEVGPATVTFMTLTPLLVGTLTLVVADRWGARGWRLLAWLGLVIGVVSAVMPFTVTATPATHLTLAPMHLVAGAAWFASVRRRIG